MGDKAPLLQRNAAWRMKPATDNQRRALRRLHPGVSSDASLDLSGEISDAIAKEKFVLRVKTEII